MWEQIQSNRRKTAFRIAGMATLLFVLGCIIAVYGNWGGGDRVPSVAVRELDADEIKTIKQEMEGVTYDEAQAEEFARKYKNASVPTLISILDSDASHHTKGRVCFYLGKVGDARGIRPVINFLETPLNSPLTPQIESDLGLAAHGLGYFGSEDALSYLERRFSAQYWKERAKKEDLAQRGYTIEQTELEFRKAALRAISSAGNARAKALIVKLKKTPDGVSDAEFKAALQENFERRIGYNLLRRKLPWTPVS